MCVVSTSVVNVAFAAPLREQLLDERLQGLDAATRSSILAAVNVDPKKRSNAQEGLLLVHAARVEIADDALAKRFPEYGRLRDEVRQAVALREPHRPAQAPGDAGRGDGNPQPVA